MYQYDELMKVRDTKIEDLGPWLWIKEDTGAWDGPYIDWVESHKAKIEKYVKKWGVCVQAGGNQGMYPALLKKMFNVVYTFEPDPLNFHCLVNNCQYDGIVKMNAALTEENKMIRVLRNDMKNTGCHTVENDGFLVGLALDTLPLPDLDFLYLDIEGYEYNAIQGAAKLIEKYKPVIFLERGNTPDIVSFLGKFGYSQKEQSVSDWIYTVG